LSNGGAPKTPQGPGKLSPFLPLSTGLLRKVGAAVLGSSEGFNPGTMLLTPGPHPMKVQKTVGLGVVG